MLASTVQFSNNERSPISRRRLPAAKQLAVRPTDRARHEATSLAGCSLRTQQRAWATTRTGCARSIPKEY